MAVHTLGFTVDKYGWKWEHPENSGGGLAYKISIKSSELFMG
jgi:hypothetical protein